MTRLLFLLSLAAGVLAAACEPTVKDHSACGPGTVAKNGICVLGKPTECGPGTVLQGESCVLAATDAAAPDAGGLDVSSAESIGGEIVPEVVADAACVPKCAASKPCGDDGCGGTCGTCADGAFCVGGVCATPPNCVSDCGGKNCGDNGCGGTCGTCLANQECKAGVCTLQCVPDCVAKTCGSDGCGGICGKCDSGKTCGKLQVCLPEKWTCDGYKYGSDAQCDCGCGAPDPDCADPLLPLLGCEPKNTCKQGVCTPLVPPAWKCKWYEFDDKFLCHCGCGAPDPDCAVAGAVVLGCGATEVCGNDGTCGKCVPSCSGKVCGSDGCGGSCGQCPPGPSGPEAPLLACVAGKCVDGCDPKPILCDKNNCGDDGCGGSCGACKVGEFCAGGLCNVEPGKSCQGYCKGKAPGGCSCSPECLTKGDCCPDFVEQCSCTPKCKGVQCGDDGCGGSCGDCAKVAGKPYCSQAGQCIAACEPLCAGKQCGDNTCGGACGTCKGEDLCNGAGLCVPAAWVCPDFYYADGSVCDCSCGTPDPDCTKVALTTGCIAGVACTKETGICSVAFCGHDGDCTAPKWCVGHFPAGGGLRKGICQVPNPAALPSGSPCGSDYACASGLCLGGLCRAPCQTDAHCKGGGSCVGFARIGGLTGKPLGVANGCDMATKAGAACTSQATCASTKQKCLAFIHPSTLKPDLRCGSLSSLLDEKVACAGPGECPTGLVCAAGQCGRPCPGGATDCPAGYKCAPAVLHGGTAPGSGDDVLVPACSKN